MPFSTRGYAESQWDFFHCASHNHKNVDVISRELIAAIAFTRPNRQTLSSCNENKPAASTLIRIFYGNKPRIEPINKIVYE